MILSMTGFGDAQHHDGAVTFALEIRSLNHRYFKSTIKLAERLQFMDAEVDKLLRERLHRGSITYVLRVRATSEAAAGELNVAALRRYVEQLRSVAGDDAAAGGVTIDLGALIDLPGVCESPEIDEEQRKADAEIVRRMTNEALQKLLQMREREGTALRDDLLKHIAEIRAMAGEIAARAPLVVNEYKSKLTERVAMLMKDGGVDLDRESLIREVAIFADRCDISEEVSRLAAHLDQFGELCDSDEHSGRKLDFLTQEMIRETNTIGAKSNDAQITRRVVEIKGGIERLKEQVQNVE